MSDRGKVRRRNEDSVLADPGEGIFILADGMGGAAGGDVASALAVAAAYRFLKERFGAVDPPAVPRLLAEALAAAHSAVAKRALAEPALEGMGTTLDIAAVKGAELFVCHVGDSRIYLLRNGRLRRITRDDTVAELLLVEGHMTPRDLPPGAKHILTQAVGVSDEIVPEMQILDLEDDDLVLLCSDGLTTLVEDDAIERTLLLKRHDLEGAAARLVDEANSRGGIDNVSVLLVAPRPVPPDPRFLPLSPRR